MISRFLFFMALGAGLPPSAAAQDGAAIAAKGGQNGAVACMTCHGAAGEGNAAAGFPRLAGLGRGYLASQLANYANGTRQHPVMAPIAKQLTDPEKQAVAAHFASLPGPAGVAVDEANVRPSQAGAWLATRGRWDQNLPACVQCHGPGGIGVGDTFPALAGQSPAYLTAQLQAYKNKTRPGGPGGLMALVASRLSEADITALANHFGGGAAPAAPAQKGQP